ncbi:membrane fusion component of tripartite multidrug resistance system [Vibrio maritimus]|uniref:Membrane fusion component of tripartite multidrug resistance system n=1 Tax=Vibrio maritimus TaxID=990268 RepID=A0A090S6S7_9VIBR|nr:membrane fusion component of tripartite multidrug resistance system [Vibrio maritimus]
MKKTIIIILNLILLGGAAWFGYQKYQDYFNNPWTAMAKFEPTLLKWRLVFRDR